GSAKREFAWNGRDGTSSKPLHAWAAIRKWPGFSHPRGMSGVAGNRHHDFPGERWPAGVCPADGWKPNAPNNQALRADRGRDYTERGGTNSVVMIRRAR